jgi:hypothetical protein
VTELDGEGGPCSALRIPRPREKIAAMPREQTVALVSGVAGSTVALAGTRTGLLGQRASDRRRYRQELAKSERVEARKPIERAATALLGLRHELTNVIDNFDPSATRHEKSQACRSV